MVYDGLYVLQGGVFRRKCFYLNTVEYCTVDSTVLTVVAGAICYSKNMKIQNA